MPFVGTVPSVPVPVTPQELYCDMLKRILTRALLAKAQERHTWNARVPVKRQAIQLLQNLLARLDLEIVRLIHCTQQDYLESGDSAANRAEDAESMVGIQQFDSMQACIGNVLRDQVPGDLLEAGVWRGGMAIFMRGVLKASGDRSRRVWVADSFAGLPEVDRDLDKAAWWWGQGDMAVSEDIVKANFARFGLLDDQVRFLKGYFSDTLPTAPIDRLAILRIDADLYTSTRDVLVNLYPKLSRGGYCVVDDYQNLQDCRRSVDEYRSANGIRNEIVPIDSRAVYWRRS
jgi:O-methyltransferase